MAESYNLATLKKIAAQNVSKKKRSKKVRESKWVEDMLTEEKKPEEKPKPDRVPVRIDGRTTVMVKRDLCELQEDGTWKRKDIRPADPL